MRASGTRAAPALGQRKQQTPAGIQPPPRPQGHFTVSSHPRPSVLAFPLQGNFSFLSLSDTSLTLTHPSNLSFNHKETLLPTHIPAHTHTHTPVHTHTCTRTHTHAHIWTHLCTHMHTHTHTHTHTPQINSVLSVIPSHRPVYFCEPVLSPEETHSTVRLSS